MTSKFSEEKLKPKPRTLDDKINYETKIILKVCFQIMDEDEDRPDPAQMNLVKLLHREMADRQIVIHSKTKKKKKRRNLTSQLEKTSTNQNTSSGSDSSSVSGFYKS